MYDLKSEILQAVSINDILNRYGYKITNKDFISCPFHNEKTASCRIYPETNTFYCFGCGAGGNVIDFVAKISDKTFYEAMRLINTDFALNLPFDRQLTVREKTAFRIRQKERAEEERIRKEKNDEIYIDYWQKFDRYEQIKRQKEKYKPNKGDTVLHPFFVEALRLIDNAKFELDIAESEVIKIANG